MTTSGSSFWTSGAVPLIEPEFLSSIISAASDLALVVSEAGLILSVVANSSDDSLGNLSHWEGRPVADFLTDESIAKFEDAHGAYLAGNLPRHPLEVTHSDNAVWEYPVRYTFHRFGSDGAALLLGRDLRPIAETQQQLVQAQIALEQGYEAKREFDLRYRVMLSHVDDAVIFVTLQSGRIEDGNMRAAAILGLTVDAIVGTGFASLFDGPDASEIGERLLQATMSEEPQALNLRTSRTKAKVRVVPHVFRAGGQRVALCRLTTDSDAMPERDPVDSQVKALFRTGTDAMAFASAQGVITAVNDAFLDLTGLPGSSDAVGRSLSDFLGRGQIDLNVLVENAARSGRMRLYASKLINELGSRLPVEISVTRLSDGPKAPIGLILRDVSQVDTVRGTSGQPAQDPGRNVVELVGSASLKEIVAETTDVVEKMCIETAVSLTRNNRVAAADMLGLSRQSLYVKLRKYGLLSKNG